MEAIITGLALGLFFGYVCQRGRFCMNSGFRDILMTRNFRIFKAFILAVLIQLIAVNGLNALGLFPIRQLPFLWAGNIIGGLIFGAGMVLAAGCASGTWYRIGEGMTGSFVAALGYILAAFSARAGALSPIVESIHRFSIKESALYSLLGINKWFLIISLVAIGAIWLYKNSDTHSKGGWDWRKTGLGIGAAGIIAWWLSTRTGRIYGLGITAPSTSIGEWFTTGGTTLVNWGTFFVIGIPFGALLASMLKREFKFRSPPAKRLPVQFIGGLGLGFGATLAVGCNIGGSVAGIPVLAAGNMLATVFFVMGNWITVYLLFMRRW